MISGSWDGDVVSVEGDMRGSWWSGGAGGAAGGGGMGSLFLVPPVEQKISANQLPRRRLVGELSSSAAGEPPWDGDKKHPLITTSSLTHLHRRPSPPPPVSSPAPLPSSHRPAIHYRLLAAGRPRRPVWLLNGSAALAPLKRCHINTEQPLRTAAGPERRGPESVHKELIHTETQTR